ncbi:MAG: Uma2 family endonuclease [Chloroflexota bacterium]|nr:Uma2 family endonuclease [Chloroflexota bacterium]
MSSEEDANLLTNPDRHYRFTFAEYEAMINAGIRGECHKVELIDGYVLEMEPYTRELDLVANRAMRHFLDLDPEQYAGMVKATLYVGEGFVPDPDYWLAKMDDFTLRVDPDDILLIIEVAEESLRFDLEVKARLYARAGVAELWVVDLPQLLLHRFTRPAPGGYLDHTVLTEDELVTPLKVPSKPLYLRDLLGR